MHPLMNMDWGDLNLVTPNVKIVDIETTEYKLIITKREKIGLDKSCPSVVAKESFLQV